MGHSNRFQRVCQVANEHRLRKKARQRGQKIKINYAQDKDVLGT